MKYLLKRILLVLILPLAFMHTTLHARDYKNFTTDEFLFFIYEFTHTHPRYSGFHNKLDYEKIIYKLEENGLLRYKKGKRADNSLKISTTITKYGSDVYSKAMNDFMEIASPLLDLNKEETLFFFAYIHRYNLSIHKKNKNVGIAERMKVIGFYTRSEDEKDWYKYKVTASGRTLYKVALQMIKEKLNLK
jgi:hypothetical protein